MTLYRPIGPWRLARRRAAGLPRRLVPRLVQLHLLRARETATSRSRLGRLAYNGSAPAAAVTVVVGTVRIDQQPRRRASPPSSATSPPRPERHDVDLSFPVAQTPVRVEITVAPATLIPPTTSTLEPRRPGRVPVRSGETPLLEPRRRDRAHPRGARAPAPGWIELPWEREEAAYEYFTTRLAVRPGVIGPYAAVATSTAAPRGGSRAGSSCAGSRRRSATRSCTPRSSGSFGRRRRHRGRRRSRGARRAPRRRPRGARRRRPRTRPSSRPQRSALRLLGAFTALGGPLERQPFIVPWTRRPLELPPSFEEFVASRSSNTRWRIRRDARRLAETFGDRLRVEIVRDPSGLDRLVRDADIVARATYQRALGAGFSDTPEQRALAAVGLEHGWVRGYLLRLREEPIAYWLCSTYRDTILIRTAGYDPRHSELRVGLFLLMRVIEDAIADPALHRLDFGPGDAAYKQQFSNESRQERNVVVFAPTLRGAPTERDPHARPRARAGRPQAARRDRPHRPRQGAGGGTAQVEVDTVARLKLSTIIRRAPKIARNAAARPQVRAAARRHDPDEVRASRGQRRRQRRLRGSRASLRRHPGSARAT